MFINKTSNILDLNKFQEDAIASNSKILNVLKFGDDQLRFTVEEDWSPEDDAQLDDFIANFEDIDPEDKTPVIYDLVHSHAMSKHFHGIRYTGTEDLISPLHPKRTSVQGEVQNVIWYKDAIFNGAAVELSTPVLSVDVSYVRDEAGFALWRTVTRSWYNRDGSLNEDTKTTQKFYIINDNDTMDEGSKRRGLLVSNIKVPVMEMMKQVLAPLGYTETAIIFKGSQFLDDYEGDFNKFINNSSRITDPADPNYGRKTIIIKFEEEDRVDVLEWLDAAPAMLGGETTIRQYLINEFSI